MCGHVDVYSNCVCSWVDLYCQLSYPGVMFPSTSLYSRELTQPQGSFVQELVGRRKAAATIFLCLKDQFRIPSTTTVYTYCHPPLPAGSPGWCGTPAGLQLLRLPWLLQDPYWAKCLVSPVPKDTMFSWKIFSSRKVRSWR